MLKVETADQNLRALKMSDLFDDESFSCKNSKNPLAGEEPANYIPKNQVEYGFKKRIKP